MGSHHGYESSERERNRNKHWKNLTIGYTLSFYEHASFIVIPSRYPLPFDFMKGAGEL